MPSICIVWNPKHIIVQWVDFKTSGGSCYRDKGIIPTNKFKLIKFLFYFKILSLSLFTMLNFIFVM